MLYTSKEGNITNPLHMWVRFLKETTYIPSLISQLNGRKMFFIKLDSNIFYKMRQFFVTLSCCSYSAVYNKVIYLSRYNGQYHWLFLSTIQYRQMRQKRKKSNITNTKSTTIPTLQNSINKTLSQPKNTKSSLLSHKSKRAKTTDNSLQQLDKPLKET